MHFSDLQVTLQVYICSKIFHTSDWLPKFRIVWEFVYDICKFVARNCCFILFKKMSKTVRFVFLWRSREISTSSVVTAVSHGNRVRWRNFKTLLLKVIKAVSKKMWERDENINLMRKTYFILVHFISSIFPFLLFVFYLKLFLQFTTSTYCTKCKQFPYNGNTNLSGITDIAKRPQISIISLCMKIMWFIISISFNTIPF